MHFAQKTLIVLAMAVLASTAVRDASAQSRCDGCGSGNGHKICRLVCDTKEVDVTFWDSQYEDFCLPGPCKMGRRLSEKVRACGADGCCDGGCAGAGNGGCRGGGQWFVWRMTSPGCARIVTKKNLMKKTVTKEVCVYKWKIENLCSSCKAECKPVEVPQEAAVPPPPDTDALILDPHAAPKSVHLSVTD